MPGGGHHDHDLTTSPGQVLDDELIERCGARAAGYDRENTFFTEDFEELRASGYLTMAVPTELGGLGFTLADVCREERRLARRAPATALATNMHVYWTGHRRRPLPGATVRWCGCSKRRSPARCSPRATARPATTCRC